MSKIAACRLVAAFTLLAASGALAQEPAAASAAQPKIEVSPSIFDFGEVWEGDPAKGEFTIRNTGNADLVMSVRSSCGCTVATKPRSPLPPGETTTFTISYSTKRAGPANKTVTITTNDPTTPRVTIRVTGNVKTVYNARPSRIMFNDLDQNSVETQVVQLTNSFDKPLKLKLKDQQNFGPFDVKLTEVKAGMEYKLEVTTKPPLQQQHFNRIVLETDSQEVPSMTLSVSARVPPRVSVVPNRLWVMSNATKESRRFTQVRFRTDDPIKITGFQTVPETIELTVQEPTAADLQRKMAGYRISLMIPPYEEIPDRGAQVVINTDDDGNFKRIVIPIVKRELNRRVGAAKPAQATRRPAARPTANRQEEKKPKPEIDRDEIRRKIEEALRKSGKLEPGEKDEKKKAEDSADKE